MRRVVRTISLTPKRSSSASMRRPMMAAATPSACAAAVRLPLAATEVKVSSCLNLSTAPLWRLSVQLGLHTGQDRLGQALFLVDTKFLRHLAYWPKEKLHE